MPISICLIFWGRIRISSTLHENAGLSVQEYQTTGLHMFRTYQNCAEEVGLLEIVERQQAALKRERDALATEAEAKALGLGLGPRMEVRSAVTDGLATAATDSVQAVCVSACNHRRSCSQTALIPARTC